MCTDNLKCVADKILNLDQWDDPGIFKSREELKEYLRLRLESLIAWKRISPELVAECDILLGRET